MVYKKPEPTDPMELLGVECQADESSHRDVVSVFAEEFTRLGFDEAKIMSLFSNPFYAGPHRAYKELGHDVVSALVAEQVGFWSHVRFHDVQPSSTTDTDRRPGNGERQ
jgi:hypothetical protein